MLIFTEPDVDVDAVLIRGARTGPGPGRASTESGFENFESTEFLAAATIPHLSRLHWGPVWPPMKPLVGQGGPQ